MTLISKSYWIILSLLYVIFLLWYGGSGEKMTSKEIELGINTLKENMEKIKLLDAGVMDTLDPNVILDIIDQLEIMKDAKELIAQFKADLQGRRNPATAR